MEKLFYRGTIIELIEIESNKLEIYMLVECFDSEALFQVVQINGYHSGTIVGYIRNDLTVPSNIKAVTFKHLIEQFKINVADFDVDTFKVKS